MKMNKNQEDDMQNFKKIVTAVANDYLRQADAADSMSFVDGVKSFASNFLYQVSEQFDKYIDGLEILPKTNPLERQNILDKISECEQAMAIESQTSQQMREKAEKLYSQYLSIKIPTSIVQNGQNYLLLLDKKTTMTSDSNVTSEEIHEIDKQINKALRDYNKWQDEKKKKEDLYAEYQKADKDFFNYQKQLSKQELKSTILADLNKQLEILDRKETYDSNIYIDDAKKIKADFASKFMSNSFIEQVKGFVLGIFSKATEGQFHLGEFSRNEKEEMLEKFQIFMDKFNWNGFSFNKNIIGASRENINGQTVYVIRAKDMDYDVYLKRLLWNFTSQFVGSAHKALDEVVLKRNQTIPSSQEMYKDEDGNEKENLYERTPYTVLDHSKKINQYRVLDDRATQDYWSGMKSYLMSKSGDIARNVKEAFDKNLPKSSFFRQLQNGAVSTLKDIVETIIRNLGEEISKNKPVTGKITNIINDAFGGTETRTVIVNQTDTIYSALRIYMLNYMIKNIAKSITQHGGDLDDLDDASSDLMETLYRQKDKVDREYSDISHGLSIRLSSNDGFVQPKEMADEILNDKLSSYRVDNKVEFLLEDKTVPDSGKSNNNVMVTPLRTRRDYGLNSHLTKLETILNIR